MKVMGGAVVGEAHRLIPVLFYIGLVLRVRLHVFFVYGAGLHVLRRKNSAE